MYTCLFFYAFFFFARLQEIAKVRRAELAEKQAEEEERERAHRDLVETTTGGVDFSEVFFFSFFFPRK